jgi:hypothetical protein
MDTVEYFAELRKIYERLGTVADYLETVDFTIIVRCPCGARHFLMWIIPYWTKDDTFHCYTCEREIRVPPEMFLNLPSKVENPEAKRGMITWVKG